MTNSSGLKSKPSGDESTSSSHSRKRVAQRMRASEKQLGSASGFVELTRTTAVSTRLTGLPQQASRSGEDAQLLFRFVQDQDQRELDRLHSRLGFPTSYDVETGEVIELTPKGRAAAEGLSAEVLRQEAEQDIEDQGDAL